MNMHWQDSNNINYTLLQSNTVKDNIPEWMDDNFFNMLQQPEKKKISANGIYLNSQKPEQQCIQCGTSLAKNEVLYCSHCRTSLNEKDTL